MLTEYGIRLGMMWEVNHSKTNRWFLRIYFVSNLALAGRSIRDIIIIIIIIIITTPTTIIQVFIDKGHGQFWAQFQANLAIKVLIKNILPTANMTLIY